MVWCAGEIGARLRGGNDPRLWEKTRGAVDVEEFPKGLV